MAETITNLKVRFGADTKQFKKGMNEGKQATQQFRKDAGSAIDDFAAAFGVNMQGIRDGIGKMNRALTGMGTGFKSAAAGGNIFTRALKIMKAALISTGIGALVVALGSLISYFTRTQRGADKVSQVFKGIGAVVDVFIDRLSGLGEKLIAVFRDPEQAIKDLWNLIKENIVNRFEGLIDLFNAVGNGLQALWKRDMEGLKNAANEAGTAIVAMTTGLDEGQQKKLADSIKGITTEIKEEAAAAASLEKARQKLRDQEIALIAIQAERRREIEAARLLAEDETVSSEKRLKALQRAQELEKKTLKENQDLQRQKIAIMEQEIALSESTAEEVRALEEEKAKLFQIESESLRLQKRLQTETNSLTKEIQSQTEAIIKQREEATKGVSKPMESIGLSIDLDTQGLETDKLLAGVKENLGEAQNTVVDFADVFNSTFEGLAVGFGEHIGNLISGTAQIKDFGTIILDSLGGLAIQVGQIAIGVGLATESIKAALKSLGGVGAIAAGVALVALGTAVRGSMAKAASGSGTSGGTFSNQVYDTTSSGVRAGNVTPTRAEAITVHVNGTFKQHGTDMVSVINETQKRSKYNG